MTLKWTYPRFSSENAIKYSFYTHDHVLLRVELRVVVVLRVVMVDSTGRC